jgi:pimeloyl-ACP methyl ester carboxylesterase
MSSLARPSRLIPLALILGLALAAVAYRSWLAAQARAVVVLSTVIETPLLTWTVERVTDEPRVEEAVVAGVPTTLVRPGGDGPWPAFVFLNGATELGRAHPDVQRLARGLARAGYLVLVPDLPGLVRGELTDHTVDSAVALARNAAGRPDSTGQVALFGVSLGAAIGLLAAERPELAERVSVVVGIAPYADLENVVLLATTGYAKDGDRLVEYRPGRFLALAVARSLVAGLPAGDERTALAADLARVASNDPDPLAGLRALDPAELSPDARAVRAVLLNREPDRFEALYTALPATIRAGIERLSPVAQAQLLRMPVELASAPHDPYFPPSESRSIARAAPDVHVTVTDAFSHVIPKPSLTDPGDLARFDGWAVRALRGARS